jgi:hypothetical protein
MGKLVPRWWATMLPDNHNYVINETGEQRCHLCGVLEPPLREPTGDERTDRAAMHLVHGVREHLDLTLEEWIG